MALTRIPVPSLYGGVSTQAQVLRFPHQIEAGDNCLLTIPRGAEKRSGTEFILGPDVADGSLNESNPTNDKFIHWIDRDSDERFVVIIDPAAAGDPLSVYDLAGDKKTVTFGTGTANYIKSNTPDVASELAAITVADATFILNKTVDTALKGMAFVYTNTNATNYPHTKGNSRNKSTWDDLDQPAAAAEATSVPNGPMSVAIGAITGGPIAKNATFTGGTSGATGRIYGSIATGTTPLLYTPTAGTVVSGETLTFSTGATCATTAAPVAPSAGYVWCTRTDYAGHPAGFYKAISEDAAPWYERVKVEVAESELNGLTMPLRMDFDGSAFAVSEVNWEPRKSGDAETNKAPLFIGEPITDITWHRNRFFFASGEKIQSSQAGDYFNLWRDNFAELGDADPVAVQLSSDAVTEISFLVPFSKNLVAMTKGSRQFEMVAPDTLTPLSGEFLPATNFRSDPNIRPLVQGTQMYWPCDLGQYTRVFEFFYSSITVSNTAVDITLHVDSYIPHPIRAWAGSVNNDFLFIVPEDSPNQIYVYKSFWNGEEKIQDSWCRWVTDDGNEILGLHVYDDYLYLVIRRDSKLWLERLYILNPVPDTRGSDTMPYPVHLDRVRYVTGVYDAVNDVTEWTLTIDDDTIDEVVLGPEWDSEGRVGHRLTVTNDSSGSATVLSASGDYSAHGAYVGRSFEYRVELSELFQRDDKGKPVVGAVMLRKLFVEYKDTGYFEVHVTHEGRDPQVYACSARRLGQIVLGSASIEDETAFAVPILGPANGVSIEIKNDSPYPCNITRLEALAVFSPSKNPRV